MQPVKTVLLVDDETGILDAYLGFLAPTERPLRRSARADSPPPVRAAAELLEGYRFLCASSGEEALRRVAEEKAAGGRITCGFFDMKMPGGIDGLETIRRVRETDPDVLCTIVTAYQDRSVEEITRLFGPDHLDEWDYLSKPFTKWEVIQKCRQMVESWNRRRREEAQIRDNGVLLEELESLNRELEGRVATRTHELAGANGRLGDANESLRQVLADLQVAQQQLVQTEKMASIGQLAAGVAHEINNPVGFVHSNLGLLGRYLERLTSFVARLDQDILPRLPEGAESAALKARVAAARTELKVDWILSDLPALVAQSLDGTDRIRRIVASLRSFSHPGADAHRLDDVNAGLRATLELAGGELARHADLEVDLAEVPPVRCSLPELNQVWLNLLVNAAQAVEATGRRGRLLVSSLQEGDAVVVRVTDDGCGMAEDIASRVFDPFFTTKEVGKGTGLGLSLAYGIIKRHGGEIAVESKPGAGTTFVVRLPVANVPAGAVA